MDLSPAEARDRFACAPVARLATADPAGVPHLVPMTFAVRGDTVHSAVDHKPKRTSHLRRLRNIAANPRVTVLVDHYTDDWSSLWWVRADGHAEIWHSGEPRLRALALLRGKYHQYAETPPTGPVITIRVDAWRGWTSAG
ncbi:PPOX class F420-dependent oxidoreductase [Streptomyces sulfonofaciens]|uniref:PPOX class F420-dependent oxidoreductase n=1 Tax=Streptomyces sulfonofaciens TaxID=68272 RepID=A0A919FPZ4_9ACTN|nr:TIGR03668 family PPOX class F420-dependent oxidoreductase [Streptomyces sulfonofaciens]GHH69841.1 PPOX class F420-dependent oxidoreductase [Streptomyces sulfonofaciens]